jgi:hypothetical protein
MAELHSVIPALLAASEPVALPAGLRERIHAAAAADIEARQASEVPAVAPTAPAAPARPERPDAEAPRRAWDIGAIFRRPVWAAIAVAAVVAALALGAWNAQLRDQVTALEAYRNGVVQVLDEAAQPGAQLAVLTDPNGVGRQSGLAAVAADGSVALVMRDLAPTSGSQVYEAWLIGADQKPVAIGHFVVGGSGSAAFTTAHASMGEGVAVALTLEPREGATTPTLPIIAVGQARAQT